MKLFNNTKDYLKFLKPGLLLLIPGLAMSFSSCKKFVEVGPPKNQLVNTTVFTDDITAQAALTAIYRKMIITTTNFANGDFSSITSLAGLSADELFDYSLQPTKKEFFENNISPSNSYNSIGIWSEAYGDIYYANAAIEGLNSSNTVTSMLKTQLKGEAEFIRAFCYFYLVNIYGDIPLITSTDYTKNSIAARDSSSDVYRQIIADLKDAQDLLSDGYENSAGERVRPNKWAAIALLARVYLYTGDWVNAESQSTLILNNNNYQLLNDLNAVFLKNSLEAIWQLIPVVPGRNTNEGANFILTAAPVSDVANSSTISNRLLSSFEAGDMRKTSWVNSIVIASDTFYFPYKYKIKQDALLTEYSMVLRLAEQYLIRSEARARQNNLDGAKSDLNVIRNRAGLANTIANSQSELLTAIMHERQVELFTEWGHRWFDLKRTNLIDSVLTDAKGSSWQPKDTLYPVPQSEIQNDPNLVQNSGY